MAYTFQIYKDRKGEFRFRFKAPSGEPMFASEGYRAKASAVKAINSIKENAPGAEFQDDTKAGAKGAVTKKAAATAIPSTPD